MRIRTIKPEFWKNEHLATLSDFTQLLAIGLLNYADDEGYFNANPKLIAADIFPLRDVSRTLTVSVTELSNLGFVKLYNGPDGRIYGHVVNFLKHQVINKPKPSKIKEFCIVPDGSLISTVLIPDMSNTEQGTGNREGSMEQETFLAAKPRERNLLMDELAKLSGIPLAEIGKTTAKRLNRVLSQIKESTPQVTPEEIRTRWANYATHYPDTRCTPEAIGKHWGTCHAPGRHANQPHARDDSEYQTAARVFGYTL